MRYYEKKHIPRQLDSRLKGDRMCAGGGEQIMDCKITLIPGDGIGPEIVGEARKVLDKVGEVYGHTFHYTVWP